MNVFHSINLKMELENDCLFFVVPSDYTIRHVITTLLNFNQYQLLLNHAKYALLYYSTIL